MTTTETTWNALRDKLLEVLPAARELTFNLGGTPELRLPSARDLKSVTVRFDEDAWVDRADGLTEPGPEVAQALRTLGWRPDASPTDAVVDDFAEVDINAPEPEAPALLLELWQLATEAFTTRPWAVEEWEDPAPAIRL